MLIHEWPGVEVGSPTMTARTAAPKLPLDPEGWTFFPSFSSQAASQWGFLSVSTSFRAGQPELYNLSWEPPLHWKLSAEQLLTGLFFIALGSNSEISAATVFSSASVSEFELPVADGVSASSQSSIEGSFQTCNQCVIALWRQETFGLELSLLGTQIRF